tara:strand:+ start:8 stop:856 length:849 start_codon:yes stop_codon:yes gene_type:complete
MISVYGGTGFIGSRFCTLYKDNVELISRNQKQSNYKNILYLISTTNNYNIFSDPYVDIDTNLKLLIEILEANRNKHGNDFTFNFVSSWFVYGKIEDFPASEDSECNPKGFYSITKRAAEQMLISYCQTYGIKYRILRLSNIYGESDKKVSKKRNALQHLINQLSNNNDINLYDDGEHIRDFLYVEDACRAINICLQKAHTNDIINIGSGNPYKFKDLMEYCKIKLNSRSRLISIEPPEFHNIVQVKNMFLDVSKLKSFGFEQNYDIYQGLDTVLESILKNEE